MGFLVNGHTSDVLKLLLTSALVSTTTKKLIIRPFYCFPYYCSQRQRLLFLTTAQSSEGSDQGGEMTETVIERLHLFVRALFTPGLVSLLLQKKLK